MIDGNQLVEIVRYLAGAAICIAFVWLILKSFGETEITVYRTNGTKPDAKPEFDKDKIVPRGKSGHSDTTEGPINASWSNPTKTILEKLKETADKNHSQQYTPFPPRFDCVVTTKKIAQSIKENTAKPREEFFGVSILFAWDDLSSVPIYDFPNNEEAKTEAMKMLIGGIRPFLVLETE